MVLFRSGRSYVKRGMNCSRARKRWGGEYLFNQRKGEKLLKEKTSESEGYGPAIHTAKPTNYRVDPDHVLCVCWRRPKKKKVNVSCQTLWSPDHGKKIVGFLLFGLTGRLF